MNRAAHFLRSVLPADPFQLFFLVGLVCLTIAPHLRWWSPEQGDGTLRPDYRLVIIAATFGFVLAASAGYYRCFWPGKRPARTIFLIVIMPAVIALGAIAATFLSVRAWSGSVLMQVYGARVNLSWAIRELWNAGTGFHFAVIGIVSTAVYSLLLFQGRTKLPLGLRAPATVDDGLQPGWVGCERLVWLCIASCTAVLMGAVGAAMAIPFLPIDWRRQTWMSFMAYFVSAVALLGISMWVTGRANRKLVYQQLRIPTPKLILISIVLPLTVTITPLLVRYFSDRVYWAAHDFARFEPPQLSSYLLKVKFWMLGLAFAAFAEEVIFRGVLQRHFVARYGVWRGIFLVGIVWAAFHFFGDRYVTHSDALVALGLLQRVAMCVILGFALSWLTIQSKSLFPAAIAHWLSNVGVFSAPDLGYPGKDWVRMLLWLVWVCVLFRFWPIEETAKREIGQPNAYAELAGSS